MNNAWSSGVTEDGANDSLMDGFMDTGRYGGTRAKTVFSLSATNSLTSRRMFYRAMVP